MARIESFRADDNDILDAQNLEHEFVNSDIPISHESIKKYADSIVADFTVKDLVSEEKKDGDHQEVRICVVDSLSDKKIIDVFFYDNYRIDEGGSEMIRKTKKLLKEDVDIKAAIARIRRVLVEELKGKIASDVYIVTEDYRRFYESENKTSGIIGVAYQLKTGEEFVFKYPAFFDEETKKEFLKAYKVFHDLDLPADVKKHFRDFVQYDEVNNAAILEKRDFITLGAYLKNEEFGREEVLVSLKAVRDCIMLANYLADNGLVLQDIGPHNIGIENLAQDNSCQGLLFDLEGMVLEYQRLNTRLAPWSSRDNLEAMLDFTAGYNGTTSPFEMVYQLGESLKEIYGKIYAKTFHSLFDQGQKGFEAKFTEAQNKLFSDLNNLTNKMTSRLTKNTPLEYRRIDLATSLEELNKIIEEFEKSIL